jgi:hypothetical protein
MRARRLALVAAPVLGLALMGNTSCAPQDPCRNIPAAPPAVVDAVADHPEYEVETEGDNEAECVLTRSGRWADETDD